MNRKRNDYVELLKGPSGFWYWRIKNINGQILLTSETYTKRANARLSAERFCERNRTIKMEVV